MKETFEANPNLTESDKMEEKTLRQLSKYIERIIDQHPSEIEEEELDDIQKTYMHKGPEEKANILYEKVMAYRTDQVRGAEIDPYLIHEIKVLFDDEKTRQIASVTFSEVRLDAQADRASSLRSVYDITLHENEEIEGKYGVLEKDVYLGRLKSASSVSSAKSKMERYAGNLMRLEKRKQSLEILEGFPHTEENTDAAASFQYQQLKEYQKELKEGFVWLPSRKKIHQDTVSSILNHRWPTLVGEAGSGKSEQADAAAVELTGNYPTEIACSSTTGEKDLIGDLAVDPLTGGSYTKYGPLMQAFTGYDDSRQVEPTFKTGRIARFDESGRMGDKGYSVIKKARQVKPGGDFFGRPMLPGASAVWTTNPVGPRYPGRMGPDAALRREISEIDVAYPPMSADDPELYEFMLTALLDENAHIRAFKDEIAPAYERKEVPEDKRIVLEDGSIIIAGQEIIKNMTDQKHGALWRFSGAIKSLQDGFVYGNAAEQYPDSLLRFKEVNGVIGVTSDGSGEVLTLESSTVTLGEVASWMKGFNERHEKLDPEFHTDNLNDWLNFKIQTYLKQADAADKEKIEAIFSHFGFLDTTRNNVFQSAPLTPKEIGYLSPRVPRPVEVERPKPEASPDASDVSGFEQNSSRTREARTTDLITFDDDLSLSVSKENALTEEGESVTLGEQFMVDGQEFELVGIINDHQHPENGKAVGKSVDGYLYKRFDAPTLERGLIEKFAMIAEKKLGTYRSLIDKLCP